MKIMQTIKPFLNRVSWLTGVALLLLATGCATTKHQESMLTAAGFRVVTASTPQQMQKLKSLPPNKFSAIKRNGKIWYVYPEAADGRIYLGTKNEYQQYQQNVTDAQIAGQTFDSQLLGQAEGSDWNDWGEWEIIVIN